VQFDSSEKAYVGMNFTRAGPHLRGGHRANVKKRLAIVLDGTSIPRRSSRTASAAAGLHHRQFTTEEAHDLAVVLRAGSLPRRHHPRRTVRRPSLGQSPSTAA
jgi:preprotein translocase subunit SecD